MRGAVHFRSSAYSRAAVARLGPALAASALVHWALLSAQKDGRAVRSRIVLSVSFAAAREQ